MRFPLLVLVLSALAAPAHAQVLSRDPQTLQAIEDAQRIRSMRQQQDFETRVARAREKCIANRGTDCDTMEGLQEWLLLDRSRAEAVLDRIAPVPSASTGSSLAPGSTAPDISPRNVSSAPR